MSNQKFKYLYGPVFSWRLGRSLGIDPIATPVKTCNFNCKYCQLGPTEHLLCERQIFVETKALVAEFQKWPAMELDYLTFSGHGEPTLAANLGEMIRALRAVRQEKIAVITNSGLIYRSDVRADLALADFVLLKLDGFNDEMLTIVDRPHPEIHFEQIREGIKMFRTAFKGKLALQLMFIKENRNYAPEMAAMVRDLGADEIELNTPLRPSAAPPLTDEEMQTVKKSFLGLPVSTVYENKRATIDPLDEEDTQRRHGNFRS
jgi:wyosine [tRNA(Phe)-imidazoG37] synthetase (radical SAM superfamily)